MNSDGLKQAIKLIRQGDEKAARQLLDEILQKEPDNISAMLYRASISPLPARLKILKHILKIDPDNEQARKGLEITQKQLHAQRSSETSSSPVPIDDVLKDTTHYEIDAVKEVVSPVSQSNVLNQTISSEEKSDFDFLDDDPFAEVSPQSVGDDFFDFDADLSSDSLQPKTSRVPVLSKALKPGPLMGLAILTAIVAGGIVLVSSFGNRPSETSNNINNDVSRSSPTDTTLFSVTYTQDDYQPQGIFTDFPIGVYRARVTTNGRFVLSLIPESGNCEEILRFYGEGEAVEGAEVRFQVLYDCQMRVMTQPDSDSQDWTLTVEQIVQHDYNVIEQYTGLNDEFYEMGGQATASFRGFDYQGEQTFNVLRWDDWQGRLSSSSLGRKQAVIPVEIPPGIYQVEYNTDGSLGVDLGYGWPCYSPFGFYERARQEWRDQPPGVISNVPRYPLTMSSPVRTRGILISEGCIAVISVANIYEVSPGFQNGRYNWSFINQARSPLHDWELTLTPVDVTQISELEDGYVMFGRTVIGPVSIPSGEYYLIGVTGESGDFGDTSAWLEPLNGNCEQGFVLDAPVLTLEQMYTAFMNDPAFPDGPRLNSNGCEALIIVANATNATRGLLIGRSDAARPVRPTPVPQYVYPPNEDDRITLEQFLQDDFDIDSLSYIQALELLREADASDPGWMARLPACPSRRASIIGTTEWSDEADYWRSILGSLNPEWSIEYYHPGAEHIYRSSTTSNHRQQCAYDINDDLITGGSAAGTPDYAANLLAHVKIDTLTWEVLGWQTYNLFRIPNAGEDGYEDNNVTIVTLNPFASRSAACQSTLETYQIGDQLVQLPIVCLPDAVVGYANYVQRITAVDSTTDVTDFTYEISGGNLPDGFSIDPTRGEISGIPTLPDEVQPESYTIPSLDKTQPDGYIYTFTVIARNIGNGYTGSQTYRIIVRRSGS